MTQTPRFLSDPDSGSRLIGVKALKDVMRNLRNYGLTKSTLQYRAGISGIRGAVKINESFKHGYVFINNEVKKVW